MTRTILPRIKSLIIPISAPAKLKFRREPLLLLNYYDQVSQSNVSLCLDKF